MSACRFVDMLSSSLVDKTKGMHKLEDLRVWADARVFVVAIYKIMADYRDYGFKDQIQRAVVSIMNNIAEGLEYGSDVQFVRYLRIAAGSCSEVKSMLYLYSDLNYCTVEYRDKLLNDLYLISTSIHRLISYLSKEKNN